MEVTCRKCTRKPTHVICGAHVHNPYLCGHHARELKGSDIQVMRLYISSEEERDGKEKR